MTIPPLMILAIGILTVIGMIIKLRINAFIALITAAILVSLMAPGPTQDKISRVAEEFGSYTGKIGIVIALAAVIGKCMMDSGAADRVVRAFLGMLGEHRAPWALMGSGFVLSVPVFFDTVFYLLVPLARSLYRRTQQHYVLYLLAIAAGGALTHTMVPPTPGPLVMAATLNINVGTMILVGALVAAPAAAVGVFFSRLIDRRMNLAMRPIGNEPEPEPLDDSELPSLTWSLLPVVLPVLMISANTVLSTLADNEHVPQIEQSEITDWDAFATQLGDDSDVSVQVRDRLSDELTAALTSGVALTDEQQTELLNELNERVLLDKTFYDDVLFESVMLTPGRLKRMQAAAAQNEDVTHSPNTLEAMSTIYAMAGTPTAEMPKVQLERFNRLLLEVSYPQAIAPHEWETPLRAAANVSALFGNANLALLISTAIALYVLYRQRKPTLQQMAATVETSLMSGGAIILITAGGGAFGAMLKTANVGPAIEGLFGAQGEGMFYLLLGFGIATLLKIAQGSGTTSMIVSSGMLASSVNPEALPYHAVYLATAIGAGSLCGSWMNDSGFWIFAKMGGLTEEEGLKTWTVLLSVLGVTSLGITLVLAQILPLV